MKPKKEEKSDRASERGSASSPVSCPSVKSDSSREYPPEFSMEREKQQKRAPEAKQRKKSDSGSASSTISLMSAKSDSSREYPPEFSIEPRTSESGAPKAKERRISDSGSVSSTISLMSAKSDSSREYPPEFSTEPRTSGTSGQTASSFEQNPDPMGMIGSKVLAIIKTTLKAHKNVIPIIYHALQDEDEQEDDPPLDDETREAALKIVVNVLRDMKKDEHAQTLERSRCEFTKLRVDHNAEHWFKPGLRKNSCELTVDTNTAHKLLILSDGNRKVSQGQEEQPYPDHTERFDYWTQVLFQQGLTGRCYWEVEWEGNWAGIGVTYKGIRRKGQDQDCLMGYNEISWGLHCSAYGYRAYHNCKSIVLHVPLAGFLRLAVYLDWEAGILSFYRLSTGGSLTHLHTFHTKFTEPLYPVFRTWVQGSSVKLLSETA
ncbi:NLR family CARD domain-containing protein 3-like [Scomber scombrus]|uniref:NLR family CARD domain-containing protein 3-like n=1 Tax=Scomber scombrus TaxID=13677 RepID=A0AAV1QAV6_SCOSC